ncbi:unnamed protein product [Cylicocyclus nassatus]|uniref:Uncharacterized protein n=1 Tax=Cylicocyclus nassatus TaxID=53992 RepID=A0AA36MC96_CYLNA|nr:unnamed protein product [Cylicocyclus nassatus]
MRIFTYIFLLPTILVVFCAVNFAEGGKFGEWLRKKGLIVCERGAPKFSGVPPVVRMLPPKILK